MPEVTTLGWTGAMPWHSHSARGSHCCEGQTVAAHVRRAVRQLLGHIGPALTKTLFGIAVCRCIDVTIIPLLAYAASSGNAGASG